MGGPKFSLGNARDDLLRGGDDWDKFSQFWENLPLDPYMGDGGTYRRRKYSAISYDVADGGVRVIDQDGFLQSEEINRLNGGITRRFEPVDQALLDTAVFRRMLAHFVARITADAPDGEPVAPVRRINIHQHRIVATDRELGNPTPEGIHRDGVEHIVMMLVARKDITGGVSTLYDNAESPVLTHTLRNPGDYIFVDDRTSKHSVTPVQVAPAAAEGHRDMFFLEFC
ncbi:MULTISPECIES: 2OG-Fe dioxygenase family protein [Streptomyces]|uniref:2OG-Fe dioxygenase family protein n=1 Tax=Streptomyces olivaceiscleroticus TaxID=68245 RepID=A0ABP3LIG1_9ACTN|nr:2OG-Fe dioxygenase family protein [Streptomyces niger]